jgi:hypothetical protein
MNYAETRSAWVQARKDKEPLKIKVLSGIIDKTQKLAKADGNEEFDKYLIQAIKSETKGYIDSNEKGIDSLDEIDFIVTLLPRVLDRDETLKLVNAYIAEFAPVEFKDVMKHFKGNPELDMKIVQEVAKALFL